MFSNPKVRALSLEKRACLLDRASATIFVMPFLYLITYGNCSEVPSTLHVFCSTCVNPSNILMTRDHYVWQIILRLDSVPKSAGPSQVHKALCHRWGNWGLHHELFHLSMQLGAHPITTQHLFLLPMHHTLAQKFLKSLVKLEWVHC